MNKAFTQIKISKVTDLPNLTWAENFNFIVPKKLANHIIELSKIENKGSIHLTPKILNDKTYDFSKVAIDELRLYKAFTDAKPLSSRVPINYQRLPSWLRTGFACAVGRIKRRHENKWAQFPTWPLDLSVDFVSDLSGVSINKLPYTPVLLTHDLDTLEGLENLVHHFLDLEEKMSARSTNYIVPCSWPINYDLLNTVIKRGHEVGIHGYNHGNKTPFTNSVDRKYRLEAAKPLIELYNIQGYRAPSLLRTQPLIKDLSKIYQYDSSIPTSGGLFPIPNNGCATARPFKLEGILEIPITLPRDGSLLFFGYSPQEILETWKNCAVKISNSGGIVNLLVHCENRFSGKPAMLNIYREFLEFLSQNKKFKFMLAKDLCSLLNK